MALDLRSLPKVLLHDHLDGGLRPQTIIELARQVGYTGLPTDDPEELARWFHQNANRGSLALYLEGFKHTIAVMQTRAALERVAFEFIEDMYHDGVVYAEVRFAPCFHRERGLTDEAIVDSVLDGLRRGEEKYGVRWGLILCAMRDRTDSLETAELAIDFRTRGVVGFDLAGEEAGHPPKKHAEAFAAIQRANFYSTLHAGETFGVASIWQALQICGAHRLGHATRLVDDMTIVDGKIVKLGTLAQYILDRRIPLEICLSSNVHTGSVPSLREHPFKMFFDRGFRVTLNTDDRLMSDTTLTKEFQIAMETFGLTLDNLEKLTLNAIKSAFLPFDERIRLIYQVIKPGYERARRSL
ncbi:MAG: adenosine deaminase [Verrucomicrobiae bacterium]|nr:adenosine deaminase [Verrucomicrobiae bacterium]